MESKYLVILLVVLFFYVVAAQQYYMIAVDRVLNSNSFTLTCRDNSNHDLNNAEWFFNGSAYDSNSPCFAKTNATKSGATLAFVLVSECEGYIQCGNSNELSRSYETNAYPERTSDYNAIQQSLRVAAGTSITLPCHVRVSALNGYIVNWRTQNPSTGSIGDRTEPHNPDYSLTLTNLKVSEHSLIYTCRVRSQTLVSGPISIDGQVTRLYVIEYTPPSILQVSAQTRTNEIIDFTSTATGSDLNFTWFLNNEQLRPSDERVERLSSSGTTGVLSLRTQKLIFNGQSKRLKLVITNKDVNNNDQNDSHEGWLFQVNKTITTIVSVSATPLVSSPPSGTSLLPEMSDAIFVCLIVVIVFVVFCCCGLLVALILSHTLCKQDPKERNRVHEPTCTQQNEGFGLTESERKNLDKFNVAVMTVLLQISRLEDTSDNVKEHIKTLIPHFLSSPSQTPHHPEGSRIRTDGGSTEIVVSDNRYKSNEQHIYDEPTNPLTKNVDNDDRYVTQYPVAKLDYVPEVKCHSNPSYETSTCDPNELTSLLKAKLPDTYNIFKELTDYLSN